MFSARSIFYFNIIELYDAATNADYVPNSPSGIGVGFSYKHFLFDINYGHNLGTKSDERYGKTQSFDFQVHNYRPKFVGDMYIQRYKGFYIDDDNLAVADASCPDLSIFQMGIVGQYIFNGNRFSYKAAFNQNEKQLKSAGSFLLGGGFYYFNVKSDSSVVFNQQKDLNSYQFGVNAGYTYNWVIKKNWLINGSFTMGANVGNQSLKPFFNKQMYVNPTFLPRFSAGYNREAYYLGMSYVGSIVSLMFSNNSELNVSTGRIEVICLYRFNIKKGIFGNL
jgi:hypothetical protein